MLQLRWTARGSNNGEGGDEAVGKRWSSPNFPSLRVRYMLNHLHAVLSVAAVVGVEQWIGRFASWPRWKTSNCGDGGIEDGPGTLYAFFSCHCPQTIHCVLVFVLGGDAFAIGLGLESFLDSVKGMNDEFAAVS